MENGKLVFEVGTLAAGQSSPGSFTAKATTPASTWSRITTCSELKTPVRDDELTNYVKE